MTSCTYHAVVVKEREKAPPVTARTSTVGMDIAIGKEAEAYVATRKEAAQKKHEHGEAHGSQTALTLRMINVIALGFPAQVPKLPSKKQWKS